MRGAKRDATPLQSSSAATNRSRSPDTTISNRADAKQAKKRRLALEDLQTNEELPPLDITEREWEVNDRFNIISDIGGGAYGIVYKATDRDRKGEVVALKKIFVKEDAETGVPHHIMREVANLRLLEPNNDHFEHPIVR